MVWSNLHITSLHLPQSSLEKALTGIYYHHSQFITNKDFECLSYLTKPCTILFIDVPITALTIRQLSTKVSTFFLRILRRIIDSLCSCSLTTFQLESYPWVRSRVLDSIVSRAGVDFRPTLRLRLCCNEMEGIEEAEDEDYWCHGGCFGNLKNPR